MDMKLIETLEELKENARTLSAYLRSGDTVKQSFAKDLVRRGKCFVVFEFEDGLKFFPSRFLGYKSNTREKHDHGKAMRLVDGKETNPRIDAILNCRSLPSEELKAGYVRFCESIGIHRHINKESKDKPRFWEDKVSVK